MRRLDRWLAAIESGFTSLTRRLAAIAVLGMLLLCLLTIADVTLRYLAGYPLPGFYDAMQLLMVVTIAACLPAGIAQRKNLKVDFLGSAIGPRSTALLDAVGGAMLLVFLSIVAWRFWIYTSVLQARNELALIAQIPVAPFWWGATAAVILCVPVQAIVFARQTIAAVGAVAGAHEDAAWVTDKRPAESLRRMCTLVGAAVASSGMALAAMVYFAQQGNYLALAAFGFVALWVPVFFLLPLGAAMGMAGLIGAALMVDWEPALTILAVRSAGFLSSLDLAAFPLFLMMGGFASAAGISSDLYRLAHAVFGAVRGGLAMATIGACAGFGALTGSSLATVATIGRVALPEMRKHGYAPQLATGAVAAGGTLGQLIPPSGMLVLYGVLTETSIGQLFIAAIVPGILATVLYLLTVAWIVHRSPKTAPQVVRTSAVELVAAIRGSWGVILIVGIVMGGIYGGVFTVTEAAAVGAGVAFLFALARGRLAKGEIWRVFGEVAANTSFIYALMFGAVIFAFFIGVTQLPNTLVELIESANISPVQVLFLVLLMYLALGCVMDSITTMLVTVPIMAPLMASLGYDLVWWGIITLVVVEIAVLTPPMGINCFVIRGMTPEVPLKTIFRGVTPFVFFSIINLVIVTLFPILSLWLPQQMMR